MFFLYPMTTVLYAMNLNLYVILDRNGTGEVFSEGAIDRQIPVNCKLHLDSIR